MGEGKRNYILIRYPAQTNVKHLSCTKQPQLGCANTSRVRPSLLCLHGNNTANRMKTRKCKKKITARKTTLQNDTKLCSYMIQ